MLLRAARAADAAAQQVPASNEDSDEEGLRAEKEKHLQQLQVRVGVRRELRPSPNMLDALLKAFGGQAHG